MKHKLTLLWGCTVFFLFCVVPAFATPVYQLVQDHTSDPSYGTGLAVVDSANPDLGTVAVEYHYWQSGTYWYYSYRIINNTIDSWGGNESNPPEDYHFGWNINDDVGTYYTINKFDIKLHVWNDGIFWHGPDDLYFTGSAGSTTGGDPWGYSDNPLFNSSVDYTVSLGSGTPLPIAPTRWEWVRGRGQNPDYWDIYQGDNSTADGTGQYFQIASTWAPGPSATSVIIDLGTSQLIAASDILDPLDSGFNGVMAPMVIPEPASCLILGLGALCSSLYRRRNRCCKK